MSDMHLHPNRGWTTIRDGSQFTPEETAHIQTCPECEKWISILREVISTSASGTESDAPFFVVADEHITAERGWLLIRDRLKFEPHEEAHLRYCHRCNDWLTTFTQFARRAGFVIAFEIPPCDTPAA
jgi:hypothetical protein